MLSVSTSIYIFVPFFQLLSIFIILLYKHKNKRMGLAPQTPEFLTSSFRNYLRNAATRIIGIKATNTGIMFTTVAVIPVRFALEIIEVVTGIATPTAKIIPITRPTI